MIPRYIGPLAVALMVVLWGIYLLAELRPWESPNSLNGCVTSYEQVHHPNDHNVTDTYFSVGSSSFHLNDGFWVPGFKAADAFKFGSRVRVTKRGSHVTDVSVLSPSRQG